VRRSGRSGKRRSGKREGLGYN
jgi:hypothetical protein